jgi:long-chain acyl-CoA synthetase
MHLNTKSLGEMLRAAAQQYPDRAAMLVPSASGHEIFTYGQFWHEAQAYAQVLTETGLNSGDRLVIIGENSKEWMVADYAARILGVITVAIYPTLPPNQAQEIALDSGAKLALCSTPEQMSKLEALAGMGTVLLKGEGSISERATDVAIDHSVLNSALEAIQPTDLCTFIYTSGTTGKPKGAMLTHEAFLTVCQHAGPWLEIDENDVFFSVLPIAHIFERIASTLCIYCAACNGMNKSLMSMASDFMTIKPTFMAAVPRILEVFHDRVHETMEKAPPLRQKLFAAYIASGTKRAKGGFSPVYPILNALVGKKIRERLGGRLKSVISGGAALPAHIAEFYATLNIDILQGYGLSETTGGSCVNHRTRNKYWTVGEPIGVELKIAQDGEILLKGPTVMKGYYNMPEETAQALDSDGWFHTGDIGEMEGVHLKITDRKKDIIVLANGKNVAPQPIENRLRESRLISEVVVLGDGMDHCVALVLPNLEGAQALPGFSSGEDPATSSVYQAALKDHFNLANSQGANFEMVKKWRTISEPFTIENGMLTPTLKVKRKAVREKYAEMVADMGG